MEYSKPPLTFEQQADKLLSRGLVADRDELIDRLKNVNYYRLTAYLYPYRNSDDTYRNGTTLHEVWCHYTFDRQLRILVMDAIERIEVAVRTRLIFYCVHTHGPFGYQESKNLPKFEPEKFTHWLNDLDDECSRSRETFISHFRNKYGDTHKRPPLWMLAEVMSFGKLLTLFNGVEDNIRRDMAREFGIEDAVLQSWLGVLNVVRNICAHHGRLWNREFGYKLKIPREQKYPEWHRPVVIPNNRIFGVLTILRFLLKQVAPTTRWHSRLEKILMDYPDVNPANMGFPPNWKDSPIWK